MSFQRMTKIVFATVILGVAAVYAVMLFRDRKENVTEQPFKQRKLWQLERFVKHNYAFSFDSQGHTTPLQPGSQGTQSIDSAISGILSVVNIAPVRDGVTVLASIAVSNVSIKIDQTSQENYEHKIVTQVQTPFTFQLTETGVIKNVAFAVESGLEGRSTILALLAGFQVQAGPENAKEWTTVEQDLNGLYQMRYRVAREDVTGGVFEKTKEKYNSAGHLGENSQEIRVISSSGRVVWDKENHLPKSIAINESVRIDVGAKMLSSTKTLLQFSLANSVRLSAQEITAAKSRHDLLKKEGLKTDLSSSLDAKNLLRDMQIKILDGTSTETLLLALNTPLTGETLQIPLELYQKIKAILILQPETASVFGAAIQDLQGSDPRFRDVTLALSEADTHESQATLREIIERRKIDEDASVHAIPMLGLIKHPDEATEGLLKSMIHSDNVTIGNSAILGLGIIGGTLQYSDEPRSKGVYELLKNNLTETHDEDRKRVYLSSLGNLGNPEQVAIAEQYLRGEHSDLRAYAASSLRFVPTEKAQSILLDLLHNDKDQKVRSAAAEALSYRYASKTLIDGLIASLKKEKNPEVGVQIIRNISNFVHLSEDALAALKWAQDNASSDNERNEAKSQLLGMRK